MRPSSIEGRVLSIVCFCGKYLETFVGWDQHLQAKHPKHRRIIKKSGEWVSTKTAFERAVGWGEMI